MPTHCDMNPHILLRTNSVRRAAQVLSRHDSFSGQLAIETGTSGVVRGEENRKFSGFPESRH